MISLNQIGPRTTHRQRSVHIIAMRIGDNDPITLGQFLLLIAIGVVVALICVWVGPAPAVVLGIGFLGAVLVLVLRFRPRWIKAFWAWCIDIGQNSRFLP